MIEKLQSYIEKSNEVFNKVLTTFKESDYDSGVLTVPDALMDSPERERICWFVRLIKPIDSVGKLAFKSKDNDHLTANGAVKHEFICHKITTQRHLQLLQMTDDDEKYNESFTNVDFEEAPTKSPQTENEPTLLDENEELVELEDIDELEQKSSSGQEEQEEENDNDLDVAVEFMEDEEESGKCILMWITLARFRRRNDGRFGRRVQPNSIRQWTKNRCTFARIHNKHNWLSRTSDRVRRWHRSSTKGHQLRVTCRVVKATSISFTFTRSLHW